ncbi:MAG: AI-2E family transporter, partial [Myxococcota bacterium]
VRYLVRLASALLLAAVTFQLLRPFLVAIGWSAIVGYLTWPLYRRARKRSGRPVLLAAVFTVAAALLLGVPITWLAAALADQATALAKEVQAWVEVGAPLPDWVGALPVVGPRVTEIREALQLGSQEVPAEVATVGKQLAGQLVKIASGIAGNVFTFLVTLLTLFTLYMNGDALGGHTRRITQWVIGEDTEEFLTYVGNVVRSVVFGLLGTAVAQGFVAGFGFLIFGVPSPAILGTATMLLSFIPVGPPIAWGGAALWLFAGGHVGAGIGMALWGFFLVSSLDNILRPILISSAGQVEIPFLIVFFGVIGGLATFGLLGLFLGPLLLALAFALLAEYPKSPTPAAPVGEVAKGEAPSG